MTFRDRLSPESEEKTSLDAFWNDAKKQGHFSREKTVRRDAESLQLR